MCSRYRLVLAITHDCNLRYIYCYAGSKSDRAVPMEFGRKAVDRAIASTRTGGALDLSFFGGEPLLRAKWVQELMGYGREKTSATNARCNPRVTRFVVAPIMSAPATHAGPTCCSARGTRRA
jgi:uncharacterized protein